MGIGIKGFSSYKPEKIITNLDLEKMVSTTDEWIYTRTGIKERRIAADDETTVDMAFKVTESLFSRLGSKIEDLGMIMCATTTHTKKFPSVAALVQERLGIPNIAAFDIGAACGGFVYLLALAESVIKGGFAKKVLCLCPEKMSSIVDWADRNVCVLFGDAAGAFLVEESENNHEILATVIGGDGAYKDLLYADQVGDHFLIRMKGAQVFRKAVEIMSNQVEMVCEKAGKSILDIDLLIPHQANIRIISSVADRLNFPMEKIFVNVESYGNTSSATIPLAFDDAIKAGVLKEGMLVATPAIGGGFTWGASLIRY